MPRKNKRSKSDENKSPRFEPKTGEDNLLTDYNSVKEKLLNYVLNEEHETGKHKARIFRSLGFSRSNWTELSERLIFEKEKSAVIDQNQYGTKYRQVVSIKTGGNKESRNLITIWMHLKDNNSVRLVTVYPEKVRLE